jgi:hypothetical protein
VQELLGLSKVTTTIVYAEVLSRGGRGVRCSLDPIDLDRVSRPFALDPEEE